MADPVEMGEPPDDEPTYEPKDAIAKTWSTSLRTGTAGLFIATVQTTLARRQLGAFGVFTTFGSTTAWAGEKAASLAASDTY
jgi:hypothetical protein